MRFLASASLLMLMVACSSSPVTYEDPDTAGQADLEVPWEDVPKLDQLPSETTDPEMKPLDDTVVADANDVATGDQTLVPDLQIEDQLADLQDDQLQNDALSDALDDASNDASQPDNFPTDQVDDVVEMEPPVDDLTTKQRPTTEPWQSIELLEFTHSALSGEKFTEKTKQNDAVVAGWFDGKNAPNSGSVVLHVGPGCGDAQSAVLLVHGAGSNANQSFVDPDMLEGGLASKWIEEGRCVFAVTFPHPFGDNHNQAVQLAAALYRIRVLTGLQKIHVVAHSKGGIVALAYATNFMAENGLTYQNDMQSLNLIAVPMGGLDFTFRHPAFAYPADLLGLYMPSPWDKILQWGQWKDILEDSIYGGAFDGVLQLTVAWDEEYAVGMVEQDYYTTYYGGTGFVSHSLGITEAINLSGNFMEHLRAGKTPVDLPCRIASGGLQTVGVTP